MLDKLGQLATGEKSEQDQSQGQESSPDRPCPLHKNINVKTLTFC